MVRSEIRVLAGRYASAGLSPLPIRVNGTKAPAVQEWATLQKRIAPPEQLNEMFNGNFGIAVICGGVSGGLEVLDFDKPGLFELFAEQIEEIAPGLIKRLPQVRTPKGGFHLYFRCDAVEGNQKLAMEPVPDDSPRGIKPQTLIETRGEGGYVLAPGCPPACHSSGRTYEHIAGPKITETPRIKPKGRELLLMVARSFNTWVEEREVQKGPAASPRNGLSPGDDFSAQASWEQILTPHKWEQVFVRGDITYWKRPGKTDRGWSATTGVMSTSGTELLCVFSTSAYPFEVPMGRVCGNYTKFAAYALLNHNGDFSQAARELARQGYGEQPARRTTSDSKIRVTDSPRFRLTDLGNAQRLVHRHGKDMKYCHPWGKWLTWDGRRWCPDDTGSAERLAKDTVRAIYGEAAEDADDDRRKRLAEFAARSESYNRLVAMLKLAKSEDGIPVLPDELDGNPWLLNVLDGTIDLQTGELRPHRREDYLTKVAPVEYGEAGAAECPLWLEFLDKIFAKKANLIAFVQRLLGYSLTGLTHEHILPIFYGVGANGKSTLLDVMMQVLGEDYAMKSSPDLLMARRGEHHPTERADLFGKRLVVAIETADNRRLAESLVKELTGGDRIRARRMREDYWEFAPTHTLVMATNHRPVVRGTDQGIWRRLRLVPFSVVIPSEEQDKELGAKLAAERTGILRWYIDGCLDWRKSGLGEVDDVVSATEKYRAEQDILGQFLQECCLVGPKYIVKASALYDCYCRWCQANGEHQEPQRRFGSMLTERGMSRYRSDGIWYKGIRLLTEQRNKPDS